MQHLVQYLTSRQQALPSCTAAIGFDGFIDTIVKLVKQKDSNGQPAVYVHSMAEWGNYILAKKGGNFSIELQQCSVKPGGNMPNMAMALAKLGVASHCIGALGYPGIDPVFSNMPPECRLYSFAPPGTCQAVEFDDGKMMLAGMDALNKADWNTLKERIPIDVLIHIFNESRLIGLLNWGELPASTGFWKGLLEEVLPQCRHQKEKLFLVDLSDCSSRSREEIIIALKLLPAFAAYGKVILSLNHNEAIFIHNQLFEPVSDHNNSMVFAQKLFDRLEIDTLVLHNRHKAVACRNNALVEKNSFPVELPKLLTGAGDNFNAGFCFAQLMNCTLEDSLLLAHLNASYYIKNAESAGWSQLTAILKTV